MNKNQDGGAANISPSATIVSGKAGQLVLSGKSITNTYQVGTKSPYTILSSGTTKVGNGPKVIVQTIDRNFAQQKEAQTDNNNTTASTSLTPTGERIPENQRITESTPIDFLPTSTVPTTSFPKVILQKSVTTPKQIKLKLGPGSIMNSKIIKGLPSNLKFQRNISTKGFTVVNSSQIVQIQSAPQNIIQNAPILAPTTVVKPVVTAESTKIVTKESTDWEQELDDVNRTKENMERLTDSNGSSSNVAKKPRLDDSTESIQEIVQNNTENIIIESSDIEASSNIIYGNAARCL